jgi:hypothetical protein
LLILKLPLPVLNGVRGDSETLLGVCGDSETLLGVCGDPETLWVCMEITKHYGMFMGI